MVVIAGIALMVLGPEKFPGHAKIFLRMLRDVRDHWDDAKREITKELNPVKKELRDLQRFKPEEFLDKMTGDVNKEITASPANDNPYGPGYPYADVIEDTAKPASDAAPKPAGDTVEFDSSPKEPSPGRSEDSTWDRKEQDVVTDGGPLTEEQEYRSAQKDDDPHPKDGSD